MLPPTHARGGRDSPRAGARLRALHPCQLSRAARPGGVALGKEPARNNRRAVRRAPRGVRAAHVLAGVRVHRSAARAAARALLLAARRGQPYPQEHFRRTASENVRNEVSIH